MSENRISQVCPRPAVCTPARPRGVNYPPLLRRHFPRRIAGIRLLPAAYVFDQANKEAHDLGDSGLPAGSGFTGRAGCFLREDARRRIVCHLSGH